MRVRWSCGESARDCRPTNNYGEGGTAITGAAGETRQERRKGGGLAFSRLAGFNRVVRNFHPNLDLIDRALDVNDAYVCGSVDFVGVHRLIGPLLNTTAPVAASIESITSFIRWAAPFPILPAVAVETADVHKNAKTEAIKKNRNIFIIESWKAGQPSFKRQAPDFGFAGALGAVGAGVLYEPLPSRVILSRYGHRAPWSPARPCQREYPQTWPLRY